MFSGVKPFGLDFTPSVAMFGNIFHLFLRFLRCFPSSRPSSFVCFFHWSVLNIDTTGRAKLASCCEYIPYHELKRRSLVVRKAGIRFTKQNIL
jgi:hypothetical protein